MKSPLYSLMAQHETMSADRTLGRALAECSVKYKKLCCSEKDTDDADDIFITEALVPLIDETKTSMQRHVDLFEHEVALQMLVSIFGDIKDEIYQEYCSSDTTILAARNLVDIAVWKETYKNLLKEVCAYLYEYGYRAISDGCVEDCDDLE